MPLSTQQIHDYYYDVCSAPKPIPAARVLLNMLIASLPPQRKHVYQCVYDAAGQGITTREIADHLKLSVQNVGNALKELYGLNLLIREERHGENGLYYIYRVGRE